MWRLAVIFFLIAAPASGVVIDCPDGTLCAVAHPRDCDCVRMCRDGEAWVFQGEECPEWAERPPPPPKPANRIGIRDIFERGGYGTVEIIFRNLTSETMKKPTEVKCFAFDDQGREIGEGRHTWYRDLQPGFEGIHEILINLNGQSLHDVKCQVLTNPRNIKPAPAPKVSRSSRPTQRPIIPKKGEGIESAPALRTSDVPQVAFSVFMIIVLVSVLYDANRRRKRGR